MIALPKLFSSTLERKPSLLAAVRENFSLFEPWLEQSGMPFFPGFTDHSPRHIGEVLQTAASLISDSAHDLLSAEDVCVLCISILLHDCGMHLTQDSFRKLISDGAAPLINGFGDRSWSEMWKEYLSEAGRFGQDKLIAIFGSAEPIIVDGFNMENISERECLLIGEFVRRHHTRLAHEIAIAGIGRKGGVPLKLIGLDDDIKDLAGLVARSHGMSIRSTFEYISTKYSLIPSYRNIKTPYLMALLRIADYVQVQSERALATLLSVKELRSPISRLEWQAHFSVRDVSTDHADPEALYVHAAPVDSKMFLKLSYLFRDIQRELDETWATLGEVYGRHSTLSVLGLTIRRIRSNLDDVKKFSTTVSYFPIKAKFESSGSDLLSLLVGPLYDYKYEVGIRELIQNSVDACREASDIYVRNGEDYVGSVSVEIEELDDGTGWLTISDNGVGMSVDTIVRFYLVAGASFRNSDAWKIQHLDDSGNSRIMRGGRFGVGALAAFLLGDEIKVTTRHLAGNASGVEFMARIDDPQVELRRSAANPGTTIRIFISNRKIMNSIRPYCDFKKISDGINVIENWDEVDWFVQAEPKICFYWNGYNIRDNLSYNAGPRVRYKGEFLTKEEDLVPSARMEIDGWIYLKNVGPYRSIAWRYENMKKSKSDQDFYFYFYGEIVVNGIRVEKSYRDYIFLPERDQYSSPSYAVVRPSISILDPSGICPINLQRSSIAFDRMGVDEELLRSIMLNLFSSVKSKFGTIDFLDDFFCCSEYLLRGSGVQFVGQLSIVGFCIRGVFLLSAKNLKEIGIDTLYFVDAEISNLKIKIDDLLLPNEAIVLRRTTEIGIQTSLAWFRGMYSIGDMGGDSFSRTIGAPDVSVERKIGIMKNDRWNFAMEKGRVSKSITKSIKSDDYKDGQCIVVSGVGECGSEFYENIKKIHEKIPVLNEICLWKLSNEQIYEERETTIGEVWEESFDSICFGR